MTVQLPQGAVLNKAKPEKTLPAGAVLNKPAREREDTPKEVESEQGIFESFSDWFSGASRNTPSMDQLPTIVETGFLKGSKITDVAKIAAMTTLTNDPNELANIIQKTIPEVRVQYDKDAKGEIYPVLVNPNNGQTAIVDRPGVDLMNLGQFAGQASAFSVGGGTGGVIRTAAAEGGKELTLQVLQAAAGGDVDAGDVVASTFFGGSMEALGKLTGGLYRSLKGAPDDEIQSVLAASEQFNVPVLTSDIYNPKNWWQRGAQITSEWLPVVGTGGLRNAQQEAREQAMSDFIGLYRGGSYEDVVQAVAAKNKATNEAASLVYNKVNPYLDQISKEGGIPLASAQKELDELTNYLLTPGLEVEDTALALADDLHEAFTGGDQSFQVIKDNIGAWHNKMDSLDPASRVGNSKVSGKFKKVLRALRNDRDAFAEANLNPLDYQALKQADQTWGSVIEDMSTSKMKAIFDKGEVTPEVARGMLFSRNKSDIKRLYENLTPTGQSTARAAFITEIADGLDKQAKGLSPQSFASQLKKYQDGVDVLFQGDRKDEISGFLKLMDHTSRAQEVAKGSGSQTFERLAAFGAAGGAASGAIPMEALAAYGTMGGVARLFESPRVRGMLVRMNGMEPSSTEMQKAGQAFNKLLLASLQANPTKGTTEFEKELSEELRAQNAEPEEAN